MPGYGGQLVALNTETPYELQSGLAEVQAKQAQAAYDQQTLPSRVQYQKSQLEQLQLSNQDAQAKLPVTQAKSKLELAAQQQNLIANAMGTFDPDAPDASARFDEMIDGLVNQGATQAEQFRGRYSPSMLQRWTRAYSANSPGGSLEAVAGGGNSASSGLASVAGGEMAGVSNGATVTDYDKLFAQVPPAQLPQALQFARKHADDIMAAVARVEQSPDPQKAWAEEATALGYPQIANLPPSQILQKLQQLKDEYGPMDNYLHARMSRMQSGIPQPQIPAEIKSEGGGLYSIDQSNPAAPKVNELLEPKGKFDPYVDAQGQAWSFNKNTGQFEKDAGGPTGLQRPTGVGGRGAGSVYEQKRAAWLAVHPGDQAGALDYAGGKAGTKPMTPAQIALSAEKLANSELSTLTLSGNPPQDAVAWMNNRKREIQQDLTQANQPTAAPAATTPPAPAVYSPAQRTAMARFNGAKAQVGTQGNPYVPTNEAQYNKLAKGAWYLHPNGQLKQKQ